MLPTDRARAGPIAFAPSASGGYVRRPRPPSCSLAKRERRDLGDHQYPAPRRWRRRDGSSPRRTRPPPVAIPRPPPAWTAPATPTAPLTPTSPPTPAHYFSPVSQPPGPSPRGRHAATALPARPLPARGPYAPPPFTMPTGFRSPGSGGERAAPLPFPIPTAFPTTLPSSAFRHPRRKLLRLRSRGTVAITPAKSI